MNRSVDRQTKKVGDDFCPACLVLDPFVWTVIGKVGVKDYYRANDELVEYFHFVLLWR